MNKSEFKRKIQQIRRLHEKIDILTNEFFADMNQELPEGVELGDILLSSQISGYSFLGSPNMTNLEDALSELLTEKEALVSESADEIWEVYKKAVKEGENK